MVTYQTVISNIEPPQWKDKNIMDVQNTDDIIKDLIYCFKKYNEQAVPVASKFSTGYITDDAKNIYSFIKDNIKYEAEPEKYQTTRSFTRIIHDKFGDCKHSALLASSIAWNLGYNIIFRFVSYDRGSSYGHVYTIIENPKTGRQVVIDPLQPFNTEKYYYKKIDYKATNNLKFNPMLSRLTGTDTVHPNVPSTSAVTMRGVPYYNPDETRMVVGAMEVILSPSVAGEQADILDGLCGIGKRTKAQRQEHRKQTKAVRQEKHASKKEHRQEKRQARGGSVVKKVALAPTRAAFSALLLVNFRGLATRLSQSIQINEPEVRKFAAKLGYKYDTLKSQIIKGGQKKPLLGSKIHGTVHQVDGIGIIVDTAAISAAAPAILLAMTLFKLLGIGGTGSETDTASAAEAVKNLAKGDTNISVESGGGAATPGEGGGGGGGAVAPSESGGGGGGTSTDAAGQPGEGKETFYDKYKTPILVVGGIATLYFGGKAFKLF